MESKMGALSWTTNFICCNRNLFCWR